MSLRKFIIQGVAFLAMAATTSAALAETLMMPNRDFLMGASEVVWGITTLPNGTPFSLDYGDASAPQVGNVTDRSYIAFNHVYATSGTFTVTLTVGAESATTTVRVFNGALLSAEDLRGLNINRAIENGLRYLWISQSNRTTFDTNPQTSWDGAYPRVGTSFAVLAFENHGYKVPNNANPATGLYEKYAVQRGLNFVVANLTLVTLTVQGGVNNPCVGAGIEATNCGGLSNPDAGDPGYGTAIAALGLLGSSALNRPVPAGLAGSSGAYVAGKTLGEITQRLINTVAWGQNDGTCAGRGGWFYTLSSNACQASDGSTVGWAVLGLLAAEAGGVTAPPFVKSEFAFALAAGGNTNGTLDYNADNNPAVASFQNFARAGIYLQALYYAGVPVGDPRVSAAISFMNARWSGAALAGDYNATCSGTQNKGCAYSMYNAFKGLKLYGVSSLPAASDWYREYQDHLVSGQSNPTAVNGGSWPTTAAGMLFSCCYNSVAFGSAIAELILAPVALIAPDPGLFSTVGLSPATATNPIGTTHTVTAFAQSANNTPVPGVTIDFRVLTGPNAGKTGTGTTGADGKVTFTYTDTGGPGTDTIQAFIGTALASNQVTKTWVSPTCDVNSDGKVTNADLLLIRSKSGQAPTGANAIYDANGDGAINVADVRYCQLRLTPP